MQRSIDGKLPGRRTLPVMAQACSFLAQLARHFFGVVFGDARRETGALAADELNRRLYGTPAITFLPMPIDSSKDGAAADEQTIDALSSAL